jgi:hypothetical protein
MVGRANTMIAVYELESRHLVTQSRPMDHGKAQLLVASKLRIGTTYAIIIEFSDETAAQDGQAHTKCEHFVMSVRTWSSSNLCNSNSYKTHDGERINVEVADSPSLYNLKMSAKHLEQEIQILGNETVEVQIAVDSQDTLYRPELSLKSK